MFCTVFPCELVPTDRKVSKATCVVLFDPGLGYCADALFLTAVFVWGDRSVVLYMNINTSLSTAIKLGIL